MFDDILDQGHNGYLFALPPATLQISAILECELLRFFAKMVGAWRRALCPIQQAQCRGRLLRWYYEPLWPI